MSVNAIILSTIGLTGVLGAFVWDYLRLKKQNRILSAELSLLDSLKGVTGEVKKMPDDELTRALDAELASRRSGGRDN